MIDEQTELDFASQSTPEAAALPSECLAIVGHLACECQGRDRAKTARQIAQAIGLSGEDSERQVRRLISVYKGSFPIPVCGQPGRGFYVAIDPDDMTHYERGLHSMLRAVALSIRQTRRNFARCGYLRQGSGAAVTWFRRPIELQTNPVAASVARCASYADDRPDSALADKPSDLQSNPAQAAIEAPFQAPQ